MRPKKFTVSDGKMVLVLRPAENGWYAVSSPSDRALNTQAKSIEGAFLMAYDAQKCLKAARAKLARRLNSAHKSVKGHGIPEPGPKAAPLKGGVKPAKTEQPSKIVKK